MKKSLVLAMAMALGVMRKQGNSYRMIGMEPPKCFIKYKNVS